MRRPTPDSYVSEDPLSLPRSVVPVGKVKLLRTLFRGERWVCVDFSFVYHFGHRVLLFCLKKTLSSTSTSEFSARPPFVSLILSVSFTQSPLPFQSENEKGVGDKRLLPTITLVFPLPVGDPKLHTGEEGGGRTFETPPASDHTKGVWRVVRP